MNFLTVNALRKRTYHSLSPRTAAAAGMTVDQLKQFCAFAFKPTDEQLLQLANYYGIKVTT